MGWGGNRPNLILWEVVREGGSLGGSLTHSMVGVMGREAAMGLKLLGWHEGVEMGGRGLCVIVSTGPV